ncbi:MAG: hypothetical protein HOI53_01425 [Francisellaceae bacterium]|nr:hypothetical protein [Francisellaceae bacterium]MBT6206662.1 hypothetical protein [Francisellaceae bacterium]MBT6539202.1 hypothetical protein [Francisellaceae bacterium]
MNKTIDTNMTSQKKIKLLLQENDVRFLGYSREDYVNMFDLNQTEVHNMRFLDYAGSLNGFTRAMMRDNLKAVCVDPLYHLPLNQLEGKIELACLNFERYLKENYSQILLDESQIQQEVSRRRFIALGTLESYESAKRAGYYKEKVLPDLGFADKSFDMALCSHFLFTYSDALSLDFHIASILELARVAYQVRIFPLVDSKGELSEHLGPVLAKLQERGLAAEVRKVEHEFQRIGNAMLLVGAPECDIGAR